MKVRIILGIFVSLTLYQCNQYREGKALYTYYCSNCHMDDGSGLTGLIPPLANSDFLRDNQSRIACIVRNGLSDSIFVSGQWYVSEMPAIPHLNEVELSNIINYVNNTWGNEQSFKSPDQVKSDLDNCE